MIVRGFGRMGRPGLRGAMARTAVIAGTATAVSGGIMRRQERREQERSAAPDFEDYQRYQHSQAHQVDRPQPSMVSLANAPSPPGGDWIVEQLTRLGDLRDRQLLTQAEFDTQKSRLLAGSS